MSEWGEVISDRSDGGSCRERHCLVIKDRDGSVIKWKIYKDQHVEEFMSQLKAKFTEMTWILGPDELDRQLLLKRNGWRCHCINARGDYVFGWRADGKHNGFAVWRDGAFSFMKIPEA